EAAILDCANDVDINGCVVDVPGVYHDQLSDKLPQRSRVGRGVSCPLGQVFGCFARHAQRGATIMPTFHEHRLPVVRKAMRLLRLIAQESLTPRQLARRMVMGQVQVYRYVWALQKEGVPI